MAGGGLPPPPTRADSGDFVWVAWYNELQKILSTTGGVAWAMVNKSGSSIADLQNKNHNLLTAMQGGTTNEYYHVTAAQYATIAANDIKYGSWISTATQTAAAANTAYAISLNTTSYSNGITLGSGSRLTVTEAGVYNVQFSLQLENTDTVIRDASIWMRRNGTDVANTTSLIAVPNSHGGAAGHTVAAWNFFIQLSASDYVELYWSAESTLLTIPAVTGLTTPTRPDIPSVIVTMDRVHA